MAGGYIIAMALFLGMLAGGARAGEENIMAMRGSSPDGKLPLNRISFNAGRAGSVGETRDLPAYRPAQGVGEPLGSNTRAVTQKAEAGKYLQWKDRCVRRPRLVAGRSLELDCGGAYGLAPRFVEAPDADAPGFLELLVKELSL